MKDDDTLSERWPSHLVIAITFKNDRNRIDYLRQVGNGLESINADKTIVVVTDQLGEEGADETTIRSLFPKTRVEVLVPSHIGHPLLLPWFHHDIFWSMYKEDSSYSHFLYLEDDIRFTESNLRYWVRARPVLQSEGLIPGFLRYELASDGTRVSSDEYQSSHFHNLPTLETSSEVFVNLRHPYQGSYLMDRELLSEFRVSGSFNPDAGTWNIRETASRGLLYENVPTGCFSRSFLPFVPGLGIHDDALLHHLPNNYAAQPLNRYGSLPVKDLVRETGLPFFERAREHSQRLISGRKPRRRTLFRRVVD